MKGSERGRRPAAKRGHSIEAMIGVLRSMAAALAMATVMLLSAPHAAKADDPTPGQPAAGETTEAGPPSAEGDAVEADAEGEAADAEADQGPAAPQDGAEDAAEAAPPPPPDPVEADPVSKQFAELGLEAAAAALAAQADPAPETLFALAGARFLLGVEYAAQERYRYGVGSVDFMPGLQLPLPDNAEPKPFDPEVLERVFAGLTRDMAGVIEALDRIPAEALANDEFGVALALDDLWIDANDNGARNEAGPATETAMDLAGAALGVTMRGARGTVVRFDAADVAWLRAYAHLLSGVAELALSLDLTAAAEAAAPGWRAAELYRGADPLGLQEQLWIDQLAVFATVLRGAPDPTRTQAALAHFQAMIANNRVFWARLDAEEDNAGEWVPNPRQQSALGGVRVDAETRDAWVAVLGELDMVLRGERLIAHWRYREDAEGARVGINLRRALENPGTAELMLWLQGAAAAPFIEKGEVASGEALAAFAALMGGESLAYAIWFN
ncbi:MAG: hypothetical protein AAF909_03730 [Pseudomonadota bacterium]